MAGYLLLPYIHIDRRYETLRGWVATTNVLIFGETALVRCIHNFVLYIQVYMFRVHIGVRISISKDIKT